MLGSKSAVKSLYKEVLSWSVKNMLERNHHLVEVISLSQQPTFLIYAHIHIKVAMLLQLPAGTIPNEFRTWEEYKEAFRNPMLEEIYHQIDSGMNTISSDLYVHFTDEYCGEKVNIKLKELTRNIPRNGDLMLLSARGLQSRYQIIKDGSFCTTLVVMQVKSKSIDVWLSDSPFGGTKNKKSSYQLMHLTNLKTYESSWEVMMSHSRKSSKLCNLILTKENQVCTDISLS
jgi:hypothetical protein